MLLNLRVADGQFRPKLNLVVVVIDWFAVERTENEFLLVVAMVNTNPHPLADSGGGVRKLDFAAI